MARIIPSWTHTLGAMLDSPGYEVRARCRSCGAVRVLDLDALVDRVGAGFSLRHRRTRCRLTPACDGWCVFEYSTGCWWYHLYDDHDEARWQARDQR